MGDYHTHLHPHGGPTSDSPPAGVFPRDHIEAYVETAASSGVEEVCFTEHLFRMRESGPVLGEFWREEPDHVAAPTVEMINSERNLSLDDYVQAVVEAKDSGLPVLLGLEVDYFPDTMEAVTEMLAPYPWDILVGAVHWVRGLAVDIVELVPEIIRRDVDDVFEAYYDVVTQLAASGTVDVLAHVDVVKCHGLRAKGDMSTSHESLARAAAESGTLVELNSSGLRKACSEIFPAPDLLDAFKSEGVGITLASDAHEPGYTGWGFDRLAEYARDAGYTERAQFRGRRFEMVPL